MLFGQFNGQGNVIGVFLHHIAQTPAIGKLGLGGLQVQHNTRTAFRLGDVLDSKLALACRLPAHTFGVIQARTAGEYFYLVSDDKGAVEAYAELADQTGILLLVTG